MHPLKACYAKLARADEHFEAVKQALERVIGTDPEFVPGQFDPESSEYVFRSNRESADLYWLSPILGDFVHNARAVLDYLVWELVKRAGNQGTTSTAFPIFTEREDYAAHARKMIRGVPEGAKALFEGLQPFVAGMGEYDVIWERDETAPLARLYVLDNADKHRSLNVTEEVADVAVEGFGPVAAVLGPFHKCAVIARANPDLPPQPHVYVNLRVSYDVVFQVPGPLAGEDVLETLEGIRLCVSDVVLPAFTEFFI